MCGRNSIESSILSASLGNDAGSSAPRSLTGSRDANYCHAQALRFSRHEQASQFAADCSFNTCAQAELGHLPGDRGHAMRAYALLAERAANEPSLVDRCRLSSLMMGWAAMSDPALASSISATRSSRRCDGGSLHWVRKSAGER